MFNLVEKRRWYFLISAILVGAGLLAMVYSAITVGSPFRLGIDFTSGSLLELSRPANFDIAQVEAIAAQVGYDDVTVQEAGSGDQQSFVIRTKVMSVEDKETLKAGLVTQFGPVTELRFESVGPTVGQETTRAALFAILASSVAILFFIALAFRKVPNAFRYGVCAVAKMFHDVIFLLGVASLLGILLGWEVDSLFLTALVTVVGFSVQDVIVVFDRIRENIRRHRGEPFNTIVNRSLLETFHRSLATQLNSMFVMVAIIFFGGASIRQFMAVLLIGMLFGTYSSLFFAVPLLALWEEGGLRRLFRRGSQATA